MFLFLEVGNSQSVSHIQTGDLVELNCHTICQSFEHFLFGDDAAILGEGRALAVQLSLNQVGTRLDKVFFARFQESDFGGFNKSSELFLAQSLMKELQVLIEMGLINEQSFEPLFLELRI